MSAVVSPNVILVLADDLGFSDVGCYGGEISTPWVDRLAGEGVRFSRFYSTPRCSPSRAALMTGLFPHQTGVGILTNDDRPFGYRGSLRGDNVTLAEAFSAAGYRTCLSGKWHLAHDTRMVGESWPTRRGFDRFFGTLTGCGSYYDPGTLTRGESPAGDALVDEEFHYTDAIASDAAGFVHECADDVVPFFLYVAFTAPHWPLHARSDDIARYEGVYEAGWDVIRQRRLDRQRELGLAEASWSLSERDRDVPPWEDVADKGWETARMRAYAAMVEQMDRGIGRVVTALEATGQLDNTIICFLSDNGACSEEVPRAGLSLESFLTRTDVVRSRTRDGRVVRVGNRPDIVPGGEDTYSSYGVGWANVSNTPFRLYKRWTHEGGIACPLVIRFPLGGVLRGGIVREPYQINSVMPTLLELAGVKRPDPPAGGPRPADTTMTAALRGRAPDISALFWEHTGNAALRTSEWKLVRRYGQPWELYNIAEDPIEKHDLAASHSDTVSELEGLWNQWAEQSEVIPYERIVDGYKAQGLTELDAGA